MAAHPRGATGVFARAARATCRIAFVCALVLTAMPVTRAVAEPVPLDSLRALLAAGRHAELERIARANLTHRMRRQRADSLERAQCLDLLAEALWRGRSQAADAESLAAAAVTWRERLHGAGSREVAIALGNYGRVQRFGRRPESALATLERSLEMRKRLLGPDDLDVAAAAVSLGNLARELGAHERALELLREARRIRALQLGAEHREVARAMVNEALVLRSMGRAGEAIHVGAESIRMLEASRPLDRDALVLALSNQLGHLATLRIREGGVAIARRLLELAESSPSPRWGEVVLGRAELARALETDGDPDAAMREMDTAIRQLAEHPVLNDEQLAIFWSACTRAGRSRRPPDSLVSFARRSLEIAEAAHARGPNPSQNARRGEAWHALAGAYHEAGNLAAARAADSVAIAIFEESLHPDHPSRAAAVGDMAVYEYLVGNLARVPAVAMEAMAHDERSVHIQLSAMTETQALGLRGSRTVGAPLLLSAVLDGEAGTPMSTVWEAFALYEGVVHEAMTARRRLLVAATDSAVANRAQTLLAARARLAAAVLGGAGERKTFARLDAEERDAELALASASGVFARDETRRRVTAARMRAALPPGSALVHYVAMPRWRREQRLRGIEQARREGRSAGAMTTAWFESWLVAFVVRPDVPEPVLVSLGPADTLTRDASRWAEWLVHGGGGVASPRVGERLRRAMWDPLAVHVGDASLVLVVPDGPARDFALATLPDRTGVPLLESGPTFHRLSQARDLVRLADPAPIAGGLLALGAVDFDAGTAQNGAATAAWRGALAECDGPWRQGYQPLAASGPEVDSVAAAWVRRGRRSTVLTGAGATEHAFREYASGAGLVHAATHGFFLPGRCVEDAVPAPLRAGIVLAGANRRDRPADDDGILTAADVALMDLSRTQLVTLSSCVSGAGELQSHEGLLGLTRALEQAGARATLTATRSVRDDATAFWMRHFYDAWLRQGRSLAEASRAASRALRRRLLRLGRDDQPGQWSAFVAAGDWR